MKRAARSVRDRLASGSAGGRGAADVIAQEAAQSSAMVWELVYALSDARPIVVARAANALKKVQGESPRVLDVVAHDLLRAALECKVLEARRNLTMVVGRCQLTPKDRALAIDLLLEALSARSTFLRVFALQALFDLSQRDPALRRRLRPIAGAFLESGTGAMKARARKLLPLLES